MFVFVYGTLKRGYGNNRNLENATYIGKALTTVPCRLYDAGFPVLRMGEHAANSKVNAPVLGEVYFFPDDDHETLYRLDRLESEGRMYHRRKIHVRLDDGTKLKVHTYVGDTRFWQNKFCSPHRVYKIGPKGVYEWFPRAPVLADAA